jgi:hypothetical protein
MQCDAKTQRSMQCNAIQKRKKQGNAKVGMQCRYDAIVSMVWGKFGANC